MPNFHQQEASSQPRISGQENSFDALRERYNENLPLISIGPLLATLWHRKFQIIGIAAVFVGLAILYIAITPSKYTALGVIVIDPRQSRVLDTAGVLSGIGANSAAISSQVEIIQSRMLIENVFFDQGYVNDPEFAKPRLLSRILNPFGTAEKPSEAQIFSNFWNRLDVQRQGLTYILNVSYTSSDPQKAAQITNAVITEYLESQVDEKSDANSEVSQLLGAQVQGLRAELAVTEAAIENFKEQNNILSVGSGGTLLQNQIEQLSAQLIVAQERARAAIARNKQLALINTATDSLTNIFKLLTSTSAGQLRADFNRAQAELSGLQASLGPRHPVLVAASAELNRIESLVRNEAKIVLAQISNENDLARADVNNAQVALEELRTRNASANQNEVELRQLERQANAVRQVLEQLINREKETNQLEDLQLSDARVISAAAPPLSATWPKPMILLPVAAFFGLALGASTALYLGNPNIARRKTHSDKPQPNAYNQTKVAQNHDNQSELERTYLVQNEVHQTNSSPTDYDPSYSNESNYAKASEQYTGAVGSAGRQSSADRFVPVPSYASEETKHGNLEEQNPVQGPRISLKSKIRRAQELAYSSPQNSTDTKSTGQYLRPNRTPMQNYAASSATRTPNNARAHQPANIHPSASRKEFVAELKRRLHQNAPK